MNYNNLNRLQMIELLKEQYAALKLLQTWSEKLGWRDALGQLLINRIDSAITKTEELTNEKYPDAK